jgi:hypothetical protein
MIRRALRMGPVAPLLAFGLLACGGDDAPQPSGRSMGAAVNVEERTDNRAPTIASVSLVPKTPRPGDPIDATIDAQDPDGDGIRLEIEWRVNGKVVDRERRTRLDSSELKKGDRVELRVVASDGRLESAPFVKRVRVGNQPPRLQGVAFAGGDWRAGDPIDASPVASDPDGDELRFDYEWFLNGKPTDQREHVFDTKGLKRGDKVHVEVVARDSTDKTRAVKSAVVTIGNTPPHILEIPTPRQIDGEFRYQFRAKDADGDKRLRYRLVKAPKGMSINSVNGEARWRPDASHVGKQMVEVEVVDSYGDGGALSFEVVVGLEPVPAAGQPPAAGAR